jgi:hypothetical protein
MKILESESDTYDTIAMQYLEQERERCRLIKARAIQCVRKRVRVRARKMQCIRKRVKARAMKILESESDTYDTIAMQYLEQERERCNV